MNRDYELGFILAPEVNEEQTRGILDRVGQIVATRGGEVVRVNQWGRRRMAYPIEHHRDGYYVFVDMIAAPETITELERTLRVSEEVLRHMITRREPRVAQKEREAFAAAAAAAAATPAPAPATAEQAPVEQAPAEQAPAEEAAVAETATDETAATEEAALPEGISPEEIADVPPAIEVPAEA
ncbi:MAG TPA: 30S ribosomal protein S6 [Ktedonobacteraceae bacterium]|nr:30S ribosomal protein S6 [Ktedonobacteraceae bacterium]